MQNSNVVLKIMDMGCCTERELDTMSLGLQDVMDENLTLANLRQIKDWDVSVHHEVFLSQDTEDIQDGIEQSTLDHVQMEDS